MAAQYRQSDGLHPPADLDESERFQTAPPVAETTLCFDWSKRPPLPGLKGQRFAARLRVQVPVAHFFDAGSPVELVAETDGQIWAAIEANDGSTTRLLEADAGGDVQLVAADSSVIAALDATDPSARVTLEVRYLAPARPGAHGLRVLRRDSDGQLSEFPWALLTVAVSRLHRAQLALRDTKLAPEIWRLLARNTVAVRSLSFEQLASGARFATLREFLALRDLANRPRSQRAQLAWVAWLSGAAVPRTELLAALNLEPSELSGTLELLGVATPQQPAPVLPAVVGYERLALALALVDRATRLRLPALALGRWNEATPEELYQWAIAALRSSVEQDEWWSLLAEVHDPVREHLRDAQLDYLVSPPATPALLTPAGLPSREAVSEFLCVDTQMTPCMPTSRIQFA